MIRCVLVFFFSSSFRYLSPLLHLFFSLLSSPFCVTFFGCSFAFDALSCSQCCVHCQEKKKIGELQPLRLVLAVFGKSYTWKKLEQLFFSSEATKSFHIIQNENQRISKQTKRNQNKMYIWETQRIQYICILAVCVLVWILRCMHVRMNVLTFMMSLMILIVYNDRTAMGKSAIADDWVDS